MFYGGRIAGTSRGRGCAASLLKRGSPKSAESREDSHGFISLSRGPDEQTPRRARYQSTRLVEPYLSMPLLLVVSTFFAAQIRVCQVGVHPAGRQNWGDLPKPRRSERNTKGAE